MIKTVSFFFLAFATCQAQLFNSYLQGNSIKAIVGDDSLSHVLWFAASSDAGGGGLWRFDGRDMREIPVLPDDGTSITRSFTALLFAEYENAIRLWVASSSHGIYINYGSSWKHLTADSGLPSNAITALAQDRRGRIWVGTYGQGVGVFDGVCWHRITTSKYKSFKTCGVDSAFITGFGLRSNFINDLAAGPDTSVWIATDLGVTRFGGNLKNVRDQLQWCTCLRDEKILTLELDREGRMWAGTRDSGAYLFAARGQCRANCDTVLHFTNAERGLESNQINDIILDAEGRIWFSSSAGVSRYNPATASWFGSDMSQATRYVQTLFVDADNNLWMGQNITQGVLQLNNNWNTVDNAFSPFIHSLHVVGDTLWVGTSKGLVLMKEEKNVRSLLRDSAIKTLAPGDNGKVWAGIFSNEEGVYQFNATGDPLRNIPIDRTQQGKGISNDGITDIVQHDQELWVATERGLNRASMANLDSSWQYYTKTNTAGGLISDVINAIVFDQQNRLWCATSGGLSIFDPSPPGHWIALSMLAPGLAEIDTATTIAFDPMALEIWVGTSRSGVFIYNGSTLTRVVRATAGLVDNFVTAIAFFRKNDVEREAWVTTRNGVSRREQNGVWTNFTASSGLASNFVQTLALQDDSIRWFGTWGAGLSRYRPPQSLPETFIETRLDVTDKSEVTYRFSARDLNTTANEFRYRHWLDDDQPSAPTFDHSAVIQVSKPGPHVFHVQAIDRDGHLDRTAATDYFTRIVPRLGGSSLTKAFFPQLDTVIAKVYWPPDLLSKDTEIAITPVMGKLPDSTLCAFDLTSNRGFQDSSRMTLSFAFRENDNLRNKKLGIYQETPSVTRLGGGLMSANDSLIITTSIETTGRYALRSESNVTAFSQAQFDEIKAEPRIFSPLGGGHGAETTLSFYMKNSGPVAMKVYNLAGRLVKAIDQDTFTIGINTITWNGRDERGEVCPSGLYLLVLEGNGFVKPPRPIKVMVSKQ